MEKSISRTSKNVRVRVCIISQSNLPDVFEGATRQQLAHQRIVRWSLEYVEQLHQIGVVQSSQD